VTNVSIDHVEYLGSTRETIATEKAGIVKPGATLVLGETDPGLQGIFLERDPGRVLRPDVDFRRAPQRRRLRRPGHRPADAAGRVTPTSTSRSTAPNQAINAAIALTAAEAFFGEPFPPDLVVEALATFRAPGPARDRRPTSPW